MKKALSSVISATILISLVVVIGVIVFSWVVGITGRAIMLEGKNIALVCEDVKFQTAYSNETLYLSNVGNIQIYGIKAMIFKEKSHETKDTNEFLNNWPTDGLNPGRAFSGAASFEQSIEKIIIVPVLIGKTKDGKRETYLCGERYGEEIIFED